MKKLILIILPLFIAACSAPTPTITRTQETSTFPSTKTASPLPGSALPSTDTPAPTATELQPSETPGPTPTSLPALRPGRLVVLENLHMLDELTGWGIEAAGHIVRTRDGGVSWTDVTPPSGAYATGGFFALDANNAWATAYQYACSTENCPALPTVATIWHTQDGGRTWQDQRLCLQDQDCGYTFDASPVAYLPVSLQFVDAETGWLLVKVDHDMYQDRYRIYHTTDGGKNWSVLIDNMAGPMAYSVTGLAFQDAQVGWLAVSEVDGASDPTADWSIQRTADGGRTWETIQLPAPNPLPDDFAKNTAWCGASGVKTSPLNSLNITFYCRVYDKNDSRTIYHFDYYSLDRGQAWHAWLAGAGDYLVSAEVGWHLYSPGQGLPNQLQKTVDGGSTWATIKSVAWQDATFDFVNEQVGWAIVTTDDVTALVHTIDGGRTWEELKPVVANP